MAGIIFSICSHSYNKYCQIKQLFITKTQKRKYSFRPSMSATQGQTLVVSIIVFSSVSKSLLVLHYSNKY